MINSEYNILIQKLDNFIRKYYQNQIIRGIILSIIIWGTVYIAVSLVEYFGNFSIPGRTLIFYSTILLTSFILVKLIIIPLLGYLKIGKRISYKQAAAIIAAHFADVNDKLLNTLELAELADTEKQSNTLILASIDTRIKALKPLPFKTAINLRSNLRYLKYLAVVGLFFALIFSISPTVFTEASVRLVKHRTPFEPTAPFRFIVDTDSLYVQKGGDFNIKLKVEGEFVPFEASIVYGGNSFIMNKENTTEFSYRFRNVNNSIQLHFFADNYKSNTYTINVLPTPLIISFNLEIDVPEYTGEADMILKNVGDVSVPAGSVAKWNFSTKDIDSLKFVFADSIEIPAQKDSSGFSFTRKLLSGSPYSISVENKYFINNQLVKYAINVIPDLFPSITAQSIVDSITPSVLYFNGIISDDYGFKNLKFIYQLPDNEKINSIEVPISKNVVSQEYYFAFDFAKVAAAGEGSVSYYFEVSDNDGVNGSKSTKSEFFKFSIPNAEELEILANKAQSNMESKLEQSMNLAQEIQNELNTLKKENFDNNISDWQKANKLKEIAMKQAKLEDLTQKIAQENKAKNQMSNTFNEQEKEILEKQKQIEEMLENVLSDELKALIEELNKLAEDYKTEEFNKLSEKLEMSYEDLTKQLDRNMEMLKQFEVEQKIENAKTRLENLAQQQQELSEQTENKKNNLEELQTEQQLLQQKMEAIKESYKEALEKNAELENPMNLEEFNEEFNEISEQMNEAQQNMQNNSRKKASKNQQNSSQKMQQLSEKMQSMLESNSMSGNMENIEDLRQIVENLLTFSFDQEKLMETLKDIYTFDPRYVEITNAQTKLIDNYTVINDSLTALAKRTPMLDNVINTELIKIRSNLNEAVENLTDNRITKARTAQQLVMTSANDLALLLDEAIKAMQEQMANAKPGNQQCEKPGQGKPSLSNMRMNQEAMKQQLEQMLEQMKNGQGEKSKQMSKQMAEMLAQQELFNQMMQQLENGTTLSPEAQQKLNEVKQLLEQNKNDLIERKMNANTLMRQQQIVTRLLEAENAENKRETEKKREAEQAKNPKISNPEAIFKYNRKNNSFNENLKLSNLNLYNFYRNKYKEYLLKLTEED